MKKAEGLIGMGLHPSDIVRGYDKAIKKALDYLSAMAIKQEVDLRSPESLAQACRTAIASKYFGLEDFLSKKVAEACLIAMPENPVEFQVDNVRFQAILGNDPKQIARKKKSQTLEISSGTVAACIEPFLARNP